MGIANLGMLGENVCGIRGIPPLQTSPRAHATSLGTMTTNSPADPPVRRIDRILAFMALGIAIVSVICFVAIIVSTALGMGHADYQVGIWPVVGAFPLFGLPIAFLMILTLLIMTFIRKGRAGRP